jgi:hypothetical protein
VYSLPQELCTAGCPAAVLTISFGRSFPAKIAANTACHVLFCVLYMDKCMKKAPNIVDWRFFSSTYCIEKYDTTESPS